VGSVIFDFDSTLVPVESLEVVLAEAGDLSPEDLRALSDLTVAGMEGRLSFRDSLHQRLAIAEPTRAGVQRIAASLARSPTEGAAALIAQVQARGHEVWIVSGGLLEILRTFGREVGIAEDRIHGVSCRWAPDGSLLGLDLSDGFATSKVDGVQRLGAPFARPAVGVGDGATDLALRTAGFVDTFVAYTEFAERPTVLEAADYQAGSMATLTQLLGKLLP
jgi:D-3-phosphoglycerate dehydrogenase